MKRVLKWLGVSLAVLLVAAAGGCGVAYARAMSKLHQHWDVQPAPVAVPTDEASVKEGARLFGARGCKKCHGEDGSGVIAMDEPVIGTSWGANLTRGKGSVVDRYTDLDWVRTIREGVLPDGSPLRVMDAIEYQHMSDRDLGLIIAYVKSLPPVDAVHPPLRVTLLSYVFYGLDMLDITSAHKVDHARVHAPEPPASTDPAFGQYVLRLQCQGCHGEGLSGGKLSGVPGLAIPANLTPDDATGLGKWTFQDFEAAMRKGVRPDGRKLDKLMPSDTYASMTDEELTGIWTYLRAQPPRPFGNR